MHIFSIYMQKTLEIQCQNLTHIFCFQDCILVIEVRNFIIFIFHVFDTVKAIQIKSFIQNLGIKGFSTIYKPLDCD